MTDIWIKQKFEEKKNNNRQTKRKTLDYIDSYRDLKKNWIRQQIVSTHNKDIFNAYHLNELIPLVQLWYSFSLFDSFLVCHFIVEFWCGDERMIDIWLELKVQRVLKHRDLRVKRLFSDSFFSHNGLVCICLVSIFFLYWNEELAIFVFFSEQFFFCKRIIESIEKTLKTIWIVHVLWLLLILCDRMLPVPCVCGCVFAC